MLFGIFQSPRAFWKYMTKKLDESYLNQSGFYTCLILGDKVPCIIYVDDLILWSKDESDIHNLAMQVREFGLNLEASGLLGVTLEH